MKLSCFTTIFSSPSAEIRTCTLVISCSSKSKSCAAGLSGPALISSASVGVFVGVTVLVEVCVILGVTEEVIVHVTLGVVEAVAVGVDV